MRWCWIITAYLLGSFSPGWTIVKIRTGKDLREVASGGTGLTNTLRVLRSIVGAKEALVLALTAGALDAVKVYIPTQQAVKRHPSDYLLHVLVASAGLIGHTFPLFLSFKGGKAVASAAGALIALASGAPKLWHVFQFAASAFAVAFAGSKGIVSVSSITAATAGAAHALKLEREGQIPRAYSRWAVLLALFILFTHRENLRRLFIEGTEQSILKNKK